MATLDPQWILDQKQWISDQERVCHGIRAPPSPLGQAPPNRRRTLPQMRRQVVYSPKHQSPQSVQERASADSDTTAGSPFSPSYDGPELQVPQLLRNAGLSQLMGVPALCSRMPAEVEPVAAMLPPVSPSTYPEHAEHPAVDLALAVASSLRQKVSPSGSAECVGGLRPPGGVCAGGLDPQGEHPSVELALAAASALRHKLERDEPERPHEPRLDSCAHSRQEGNKRELPAEQDTKQEAGWAMLAGPLWRELAALGAELRQRLERVERNLGRTDAGLSTNSENLSAVREECLLGMRRATDFMEASAQEREHAVFNHAQDLLEQLQESVGPLSDEVSRLSAEAKASDARLRELLAEQRSDLRSLSAPAAAPILPELSCKAEDVRIIVREMIEKSFQHVATSQLPGPPRVGASELGNSTSQERLSALEAALVEEDARSHEGPRPSAAARPRHGPDTFAVQVPQAGCGSAAFEERVAAMVGHITGERCIGSGLEDRVSALAKKARGDESAFQGLERRVATLEQRWTLQLSECHKLEEEFTTHQSSVEAALLELANERCLEQVATMQQVDWQQLHEEIEAQQGKIEQLQLVSQSWLEQAEAPQHADLQQLHEEVTAQQGRIEELELAKERCAEQGAEQERIRQELRDTVGRLDAMQAATQQRWEQWCAERERGRQELGSLRQALTALPPLQAPRRLGDEEAPGASDASPQSRDRQWTANLSELGIILDMRRRVTEGLQAATAQDSWGSSVHNRTRDFAWESTAMACADVAAEGPSVPAAASDRFGSSPAGKDPTGASASTEGNQEIREKRKPQPIVGCFCN